MMTRVCLLVLLLGSLGASAAGASPSFVSVETLAALREAADAGVSPHVEDRARLLQDARQDWRWGSVGGRFVTSGPTSAKTCHPEGDPDGPSYLSGGAPDAYAMALAAHLTGDDSHARNARTRVLDLVDTHGFDGLDGRYGGGNQCILDLALSVPIWIETARLLEATEAWQPADSETFGRWLASEVHPLVAWASHARSNNWGAAGSLAGWSIARYVEGRVDALETIEPVHETAAPADAAARHAALQLSRLRGELPGDARCAARGVQSHGGIPEELRRGATGCDGAWLVADDASWRYQALHVELLVLHAELMRHEGDLTLYEAEVVPGAPAILQAILFVIDNPTPGGLSWPWPSSRHGMLQVASTFYGDASLAEAAAGSGSFRGGRILPYARVTHGPDTPHDPDPTVVRLGTPGKPFLVLED